MKGLINFKALVSTLDGYKYQKLDSRGIMIDVKFELNKPASINDILNVENELGISLPNSYREFLKNYNGVRIFDYDGLDGFILLGTNDIVKANRFAEATFEEDWKESIIIFAKYIGESNYLGFDSENDNGEYAVVDCFFDELPEDWQIIADNFDEFLFKITENHGDKFWLNQ